MAFEKRIWVDVPDPNNLPEVPQEAIDIGQNYIPTMDAQELNRLENGIKNNETEVKKTSDNITSLITKINSMPFMVVRDESGVVLEDYVTTDVGISNSFTYSSGSTIVEVDVEKGESVFDGYHLNLTGEQASIRITLTITTSRSSGGSSGNWYLSMDASIVDENNNLNISIPRQIVDMTGGWNGARKTELHIDIPIDTIGYLYRENPSLSVKVVYGIYHPASPHGASINNLSVVNNFTTIQHNVSKRYQILANEP